MILKVLATSFSKNKQLCNELLQYFPEAQINSQLIDYKGDTLIEIAKDADALIVGREEINAEVLKNCKKLKIISKHGVGLDNLDLDFCEKNNISVGWTAGVNKTSVAEMTLAFMLMLQRNIYFTSNLLKNGVWEKNGGRDLSQKTIGIIGLGNVGCEVVRLLKPFHCNILGNDIVDKSVFCDENNVKFCEKSEIYVNSDILTAHVPLTSLTEGMFDKTVFEKMKSTAFFINTARGKVMKTKDLHFALRNKIIAGAALDAYETEPTTLADQEFLSFSNLINTPHIGGNSVEAVLSMGKSAIEHLRKFFKR